jgi:hypothetical protein
LKRSPLLSASVLLRGLGGRGELASVLTDRSFRTCVRSKSSLFFFFFFCCNKW